MSLLHIRPSMSSNSNFKYLLWNFWFNTLLTSIDECFCQFSKSLRSTTSVFESLSAKILDLNEYVVESDKHFQGASTILDLERLRFFLALQ